MQDSEPMHIDIVSDVMCPWCYIGKRRLEKALASVPEIPVTLRWLPFQLDPTLPREGKDRQTYLSEKFGGAEQAEAVYEPVREAGRQEGIPFAFDKIQKSPNTLDCHRLILWSRAEDAQTEMAERLFRLYFVEGADLTDRNVLVQAAEDVGMMSDLVAELLPTDSDMEKIQKDLDRAQAIGVTGVPCFIIDERFMVMGAEKPETLAAAIKHAHDTRPGPEVE